MDTLNILKANLGISGTARDTYLQSIIDSVTDELTLEKGVSVSTPTGQMFLIDYAAWRFRNRGEGTIPRNLQYRLHNLMINTRDGGESDE
ncbi:phage head-tail connector protein [Lacticaseibacillus brantae]|uniref:Phage protein n=1 Tax=Lacticaseibacillus brantae DSM 23927 TaxID=1423727 RepID=A0A0R2BBJ0_9LACO|nr:phage head-tail connector protein [Lacticaseibacillus brantae]KRM73011.1 hypothetical protein FC34_GL000731 [Lacticaseibacillus brantae DSM 23927]